MAAVHVAAPRLPAIIPSTPHVFVGGPSSSGAAAVRRAADAVVDGLVLLVLILSIPFVILAVGIPFALILKLLLRIGGLA